jgi:glycosyltransferase involved in cell wall biosynthesis
MAGWFERRFFKKIVHVKTILARGDDKAIQEMIARSNGIMLDRKIVKFPTRVRTDIFRPLDKMAARKKLNLPENTIIIVTTGRLSWLKGWKFMIDSFARFSENEAEARFLFIGEGEDYDQIKLNISKADLADKILLEGKKSRAEIALYLNASDLYIMGSYKEGWPTALMEAVACGVPACITGFSAADEIILNGVNGYVVWEHDVELFTRNMFKAMKLERPVKNDHVTRYSMENLKNDLLSYWELT